MSEPIKTLKLNKQSGSRRILIVDDEVTFIFACQRILQNLGYKVDTSENFEGAKALLDLNKYSIVITDLILDKEKGYEGLDLIKHVKENWPDIKLIMITAFGNHDIYKLAFESGVDFYFEKPIHFNKLKEAISKWE